MQLKKTAVWMNLDTNKYLHLNGDGYYLDSDYTTALQFYPEKAQESFDIDIVNILNDIGIDKNKWVTRVYFFVIQ